MEAARQQTTLAVNDGARHAALRAVLKLLEHWPVSYTHLTLPTKA